MRTTKKLTAALTKIEEEATERIKSFFKNKPYVRIVIDKFQNLSIGTGIQRATVLEINEDGSIIGVVNANLKQRRVLYQPQDLSADALLTILDELERMKKNGQLKKP